MTTGTIATNSTKYRWVGLAGIAIVIVNNWLGLFILEPIARLLMLVFAFLYWKTRKDSFSVLLLICALIIFIFGITTILGIFITPNLL